MQRVTLPERPGWRDRATELGFTFADMGGEPYWDETSAYRFTLRQIEDDIEAPGTELHAMCREAVAHAVMLALAVHVVRFQLSLPVFAAIVQAIVAVLVMWSFTTAVLTMRKKPERVPQTVSALLVTNAIFSLLLREFEFELAQPAESYHNDHSKMVVQLAQPCKVRYRKRVL